MSEIKVTTPETAPDKNSHKGRWSKLDGARNFVLQRARNCAELTIPSLLPPMGHTENSNLPSPYQGMGARGVNNLAAKLILALLPPNAPFFREKLDEAEARKNGLNDEQVEDAQKVLAEIEKMIMEEMEAMALRVPVFEAIRHLIVTGNALLFLNSKKQALRVYRLDNYVVKRDPMGAVLEIIVKEEVTPLALPESIRAEVIAKQKNIDTPVEIYTRVIKMETHWRVSQEVHGIVVPDSHGIYKLDNMPWLALRWMGLHGEDYGRGLAEEHLGDLRSLEALTMAVVEGSAAMAKVLFLVNPNGVTTVRTVSQSENGAVKPGRSDDVTVMQVQKHMDFQVATNLITEIKKSLAQVFMLNSAIQRQGERVTAEEIRFMARELEDTLGGVYSLLSQEMQLPLLKLVKQQMIEQRKLPDLPKDATKTIITTGLEALGRTHDVEKLQMFMTDIAPLGPQGMQYISAPTFIERSAIARGVDTDSLIRSEEVVQAEKQQMQAMAIAEKAAPQAAGALGKGLMPDASKTQGQ
jgi:hypothetical protein